MIDTISLTDDTVTLEHENGEYPILRCTLQTEKDLREWRDLISKHEWCDDKGLLYFQNVMLETFKEN